MDAPTPLHLRIQAALRSELTGGELPPEQPLPGEHALARRFGAARMTVRRALAALQAEGLIRREPGRGTWPMGPAVRPAQGLNGLHADIRRFAATSAVRVLSCRHEPASPAASLALEIAEAATALRIVRVRSDADGPFSHVTTWVPAGLLDGLDPVALGTGAILDALAERGHVGAGAAQMISAVAADPEVAAALGLAVGSPLTRLDRTIADESGRPIEFSRWLYRPDRFAYCVPLGAGAAQPPRWVAPAAA